MSRYEASGQTEEHSPESVCLGMVWLKQRLRVMYLLARSVTKFEVWGCNMSLGGLKPCLLTVGLTHWMFPMGGNPTGEESSTRGETGICEGWRRETSPELTCSSSSRNANIKGNQRLHFCLLGRVGQFGDSSVPLLSVWAPRTYGLTSRAKEKSSCL